MTTATVTTVDNNLVNGINVLSLNNNDHHHKYNHHNHHDQQPYYSSLVQDNDDTTSEITVITTSNNNNPTVNSNNWLEEIEHSFNMNNDYQDHHSIIQSYLEPTCIMNKPSPLPSPPSPPSPPSSVSTRFSVIKSRVKRVFGINGDKQQLLMQSSLPVFPTNKRYSKKEDTAATPSIESICSTSTIKDNDSSTTSSSLNKKIFNHRHSCGISTASFTRNSAILVDAAPVATKGILKKRKPMYPPTSRPKSMNAMNYNKKKRWSTARLSSFTPVNNKRYTLSSMMTKRKKSTEVFATGNSQEGGVKFNKCVNVHETYSKGDYDRSSDPEAVCTRLTANLAQQIKQELNHYKLHEMSVHDSSRIHTHFFL